MTISAEDCVSSCPMRRLMEDRAAEAEVWRDALLKILYLSPGGQARNHMVERLQNIAVQALQQEIERRRDAVHK